MLLCFIALFSFTPRPAYAFSFFPPPPLFDAFGDVCPGPGLTRRIVPCIEGTILYGANTLLGGLSDLMADTVAVACVLALALWGTMAVAGKVGAPGRDGIVLAVKIGAVILFTTNFAAPFFDPANINGGLFGLLLDCMDELMGIVTNYVTDLGTFVTNPDCVTPIGDPSSFLVWDTIDCMLETLTGGIFNPYTLMSGLIGFLIASLFTDAIGFFIALIGFYLILQLVMAVARCLYIIVSCYIGFAIMIMISPFFVPLILFRATKSYFLKWMRMTIGYMLQPMIICAYVGMLAIAFDAVVYSGPDSLYRTIAAPDIGIPLGVWLGEGMPAVSCDLPHGVFCKGSIGTEAVQVNPKRTAEVLGPPNPAEEGELGNVGQISSLFPCDAVGSLAQGDPAQGCLTFMLSQMGIGWGTDPTTGLPDTRFFKIGMPVTIIDWGILAAANGYPLDVPGYLLNLFLSLIMAAITVYLFTNLLNYMPFISAGLAGNPFGMSFGTGKMIPQVIEKLSWNSAEGPAGFK